MTTLSLTSKSTPDTLAYSAIIHVHAMFHPCRMVLSEGGQDLLPLPVDDIRRFFVERYNPRSISEE